MTSLHSRPGEEPLFLVYEHRSSGRKLVPSGPYPLTELDLITIISKNPDIRMTQKTIKPGQTSVDIFKVDLMTDDEKSAHVKINKSKAGNDNGKEKEAQECPWKVFLGHEMVTHKYTQLTILTPESVAKGGKVAGKGKG